MRPIIRLELLAHGQFAHLRGPWADGRDDQLGACDNEHSFDGPRPGPPALCQAMLSSAFISVTTSGKSIAIKLVTEAAGGLSR